MSTLHENAVEKFTNSTKQINLPPTDQVLTIAHEDALEFQSYLAMSKLSTMSCDELYDKIQRLETAAQVIEKNDFVLAFQTYMKDPNLPYLGRIFDAYDCTGQSLVDTTELCIGCSLLLEGTVQEKLHAMLLLCCCSDRASVSSSKCTISEQNALRCLQSVLLGLHALFSPEECNHSWNSNKNYRSSMDSHSYSGLISRINKCVRETVDRFYEEESISGGGFAFSSFWKWYTSSGHMFAPWINALDCSNWTNQQDSSRTATSSFETNEISKMIDDYDSKSSTLYMTFHFPVSGSCFINISEQHARRLNYILNTSSFMTLNSNSMYDTFMHHANADGMLQEGDFIQAITELLSWRKNCNYALSDSEFSTVMIDIFNNFCNGKDETLVVNAKDLAGGFSIFCGGSKSDKLIAAFKVFDQDCRGHLTCDELWRFIRSLIICVLGLVSSLVPLTSTTSTIADFVNNGSQVARRNICGDNSNETYTFEQFGEWYNSGGFKTMSWLELLDLRKWCFVWDKFELQPSSYSSASTVYHSFHDGEAQNALSVSTEQLNNLDHPRSSFIMMDSRLDYDFIEETKEQQYSTQANGRSALKRDNSYPFLYNSKPNRSNATSRLQDALSPSLPATCRKSEIILNFDLFLETEDPHNVPITHLCFTNGDLLAYFEMQQISQLETMDINSVFEAFEPFLVCSSFSLVDKGIFNACISQLLPNIAFSASQEKIGRKLNTIPPRVSLEKTLSGLFFAFNRGGTGKIDLTEFVAAFVLFCAGSKSDKLAFAFKLFDEDRDGILTRREMWKFLRSFLTILLALGNGADLSAESLANVSDSAAVSITNRLFQTTGTPIINNDNGGSGGLGSALGGLFANSKMKSKVLGVSFQSFAEWYTNGGFQLIPWIELLDTRKWPVVDLSVALAIQENQVPKSTCTVSTVSTNSSMTGDDGEEGSLSKRKDFALPPPSASSHFSSCPCTHKKSNSSSCTCSSSSSSSNAVVFEFQLTSYDDTTLRIRYHDAKTVYALSDKLRLGNVSLMDLYTCMASCANGKILSKAGFLCALQDLLPEESVDCSKEEEDFVSNHLFHLFSLFEIGDRHPESLSVNNSSEMTQMTLDYETGVVLLHFVCGLAILCKGSKSIKLDVIFQLLDTQGDGYISRRHLYDFLRSVLLFLSSFAYPPAAGGSKKLSQLEELRKKSFKVSCADRAAGAITSVVFCEASMAHEDVICLEEFAQWYSDGGYNSAPWIELLDLSKWPSRKITHQSCHELHQAERSSLVAQENPHRSSLDFHFDMQKEGNILNYTDADITFFIEVLQDTGMRNIDVNAMHKLFLSASFYPSSGASDIITSAPLSSSQPSKKWLVLDRKKFYSCIRKLVPHVESVASQRQATKLLSRLFNVFDREDRGIVSTLELASGLTILGKGSKSHKLAHSFQLFERLDTISSRQYGKGGRENGLSESGLFLFLRSLLLALLALGEESSQWPKNEIYAKADSIISAILSGFYDDIYQIHPKSPQFIVSFQVFGEWYNTGGYKTISWVELLDSSKWEPEQHKLRRSSLEFDQNFRSSLPNFPSPQPSQRDLYVEGAALEEVHGNEGSTDSDSLDFAKLAKLGAEKEEAKNDNTVLLEFYISKSSAELVVLQSDVTRLQHFLHHSSIHLLSPIQLFDVINHLEVPERNFFISEKQFSQTFWSLVGCSEEEHDTNDYYSNNSKQLLNSIFDSFDFGKDKEESDIREIFCGLILFTDGSFIDKLKYASKVLDITHRKNNIKFGPNSTSIKLFSHALGCFLTTLYALSGSLGHEAISISSKHGSKEVIRLYHLRENSNEEIGVDDDHEIFLDSFEEWYTEAGYHDVPWMELLELDHWPLALNLLQEDFKDYRNSKDYDESGY